RRASRLVGTMLGDGLSLAATPLTNGNYVVQNSQWDDGPIADVGAVTWGNGASGTSGPISAATSLVGSTASDLVGSNGVAALSNGNYVVDSPNWNNGAIPDAGAATWGSGTTGVSGGVSVDNGLVGSKPSDFVGLAKALSNGNYVVRSAIWDNGLLTDAGAATWGSGTVGVKGAVSAANSLVGAAPNTQLLSIVEDDVNGTFIAPF